VFLAAFLLGIRSTFHLWQYTREDRGVRQNRILRAIFLTAGTVTLAAGWFGFLTLRRLAGLEPIGGLTVVNVLVAALVLIIPWQLQRVVEGIRRGPD
jgi:hypothetical protein